VSGHAKIPPASQQVSATSLELLIQQIHPHVRVDINFFQSTTILGWRSVCFVRCLPWKNIYLDHFLVAAALFMLHLGQNRA
jgi:hypothetical protein